MTKEKTREELLNILDKHFNVFTDSAKLQEAMDIIIDKTVFAVFDDIEKLKHNLNSIDYKEDNGSAVFAFQDGIGATLKKLNELKQKWLKNE